MRGKKGIGVVHTLNLGPFECVVIVGLYPKGLGFRV